MKASKALYVKQLSSNYPDLLAEVFLFLVFIRDITKI